MSDNDIILERVVIGAVAVSGGLWLLALWRLLAGKPLIAYEPRRRVPWGAVDLALAIFLLYSTVLVSRQLLAWTYGIGVAADPASLTPREQALVILAASIASALTVATVVVAIVLHTCSTERDLGVSFRHIRRDVGLGVMAFMMLAPPVLAIQSLLVRFWPSAHPLIELVKEQPDAQRFAIVGFAAVLVAPLVEEFMFRVLLQGWLEKLSKFQGPREHLLLGTPRLPTVADEAATQIVEDRANKDANPYLPPQLEYELAAPNVEYRGDKDARPTIWPILVSAALFSLVHFSHGPDWVALFVLAIGLGYLYQRTHRVLPGIVVHFLLNAWSVTWLVLDAYGYL